MRDIPIIMSIVIWWFLLATILTFMFQDPFIRSQAIGINSTYDPGNVTTSFSLNESSDNPVLTIDIQQTSFWGMFVGMFTNRIPSFIGSPPLLITIITFINWFLVFILGLLAYRQIRSGGG